MTHTLVASATRQHIIGFDRPFTVIGERINPTGRKKLAAEMQAGNFDTIIRDALAQVAAGAHILDVTAGVTAVNPNETEPPLLRQTLEIVQSITDIPLCIDSSVTSALKAGLEAMGLKFLVKEGAGLPQMKLAWACLGGPDAVVQEALGRLEIIADTFLSVATPVQLALPALLAAHAPVTTAIRERVAANLSTLRRRPSARPRTRSPR